MRNRLSHAYMSRVVTSARGFPVSRRASAHDAGATRTEPLTGEGHADATPIAVFCRDHSAPRVQIAQIPPVGVIELLDVAPAR